MNIHNQHRPQANIPIQFQSLRIYLDIPKGIFHSSTHKKLPQIVLNWKCIKQKTTCLDFLFLFISVINQLYAQNFFTISLFHASTCFEHMCSSSRGQNCITQSLVSSHRLVHRCTRRCDDTRDCVMQF